jgi:tetratricopeptide (TPR) repeat protein
MKKQTERKQRLQDKSEYSGPTFVIRWKWLFGGFAVLLLIAGLLTGIRFLRFKDHTGTVMNLVDKHIEEGNLQDALLILDRQHQAAPQNKQILTRLADMMAEYAVSNGQRNAAIGYYNALLALSTQEESVQILEKILNLNILLNSQDSSRMINTAKRLLKLAPENPIAWKALALGRYREFEMKLFKPVEPEPLFIDEFLKRALDLNPYDVALTMALTSVLRNNSAESLTEKIKKQPLPERQKEADRIVAEMVVHNPENIQVLLASVTYRRFFNLMTVPLQEDEELKTILKLDPNNAEALLMSANGLFASASAQQRDHHEESQRLFDDAIKQYQKVIELYPANSGAYIQLASLYGSMENASMRIQSLQNGAKATRQANNELLITLLLALLETGDAKSARESLHFLLRNIDTIPNDSFMAEQLRKTAILIEAQIDAMDSKPSAAITKFQRIIGDGISEKERLDPYIVFRALNIYVNLLVDRGQPDIAVDAVNRNIHFFELGLTPATRSDSLEFRRLESISLMEIDLWERLNRKDNVQLAMGKFISNLKEVSKNHPDDVRTKVALLTWQFQNILTKPAGSRDWTPILTELEAIEKQKNLLPLPWKLDLLAARIAYEKEEHSPEARNEILIQLRTLENQLGSNIPFLVQLMEEYLFYNTHEDITRVAERIRNLPNGMPIVYLASISAALREGNLDLVKQNLDEALQKVPEEFRKPFAAFQEKLNSIPADKIAQGIDVNALMEQAIQEREETVTGIYQNVLHELYMGNLETAKQREEELRQKEGENGSLWIYCKAARLILEAKGPDDPCLDKAVELQKSLVGKRPDWDMVYLLDSTIQEKRENLTGMISAETQAIRAGNRNPDVYRELVALLRQNEQKTEADRVWEEGKSYFPEQMEAPYFPFPRFPFPFSFHVMFKDILMSLRHQDDAAAEEKIHKWLKLAQERKLEEEMLIRFKTEIGRVYMNVGAYEKAKPYLEDVAKLGDDAILPLAALNARMGNVDEAFRMILDAAGKGENIPVYVASMLGLLNEFKPSEGILKQIDDAFTKVNLEDFEIPPQLVRLAQYWLFRNKNTEAIRVYEKTLELVPDEPTVSNDLSLLIAMEKKDFTRAYRLIDAALEQAPESPTLLDTKGLIFLLEGKSADAVTWFDMAVKKSINSPLYVMHLATAQLRSGNTEEAKKNYESIRKIIDENKNALSESNKKYAEELENLDAAK